MTASDRHATDAAEAGRLNREIAIQAELLALNIALGDKGAGQASEELYALARDVGRAGRKRVVKVPEQSVA